MQQSCVHTGLDRNGKVKQRSILCPLENFSLKHWSKLEIKGESQPVERYNHSAVCLEYGGDHPHILVTGGLDEKKEVLDDAWILDISAGRWRKVSVW